MWACRCPACSQHVPTAWGLQGAIICAAEGVRSSGCGGSPVSAKIYNWLQSQEDRPELTWIMHCIILSRIFLEILLRLPDRFSFYHWCRLTVGRLLKIEHYVRFQPFQKQDDISKIKSKYCVKHIAKEFKTYLTCFWQAGARLWIYSEGKPLVPGNGS